MAEDEHETDAASIFFLSMFGFTMVAFPAVATVNTTLLDGRLNGALISLVSLFVSVPFALEFTFSRRDPFTVGKYVVAVLVLYVPAIVVQALVHLALGFDEPLPAVQYAVLVVTYVVAYLLVYKGGYRRIRGTTTG